MVWTVDTDDSFQFSVFSFKSNFVAIPRPVANGQSRAGRDFGLWTFDFFDYRQRMALVRILVDGYSLLHNWPELAQDQPRHSERARDELVRVLTRYHDAVGTPITVFFDGSGAPLDAPKNGSDAAVEILFSCSGQTADQMIERAAHRFRPYGEVLVVTDDRTEREVVGGAGGTTASCANFIRAIEGKLKQLQNDLRSHNRIERSRFGRDRQRHLKRT
jgi:predicted RNA-binding protein with PIN domain